VQALAYGSGKKNFRKTIDSYMFYYFTVIACNEGLLNIRGEDVTKVI